METKNYEHITYDPNLFHYLLESPLQGMDPNQRFGHCIQTVATIIDSFQGLIRPTGIEYEVADSECDDGTVYQQTLSDERGLSTTEIIHSLSRTAQKTETPDLAVFKLTGSVRITLSSGVHYISGSNDVPVVRNPSESSNEVSTPLQIDIRQHGVMKPCITEMVTITANSDHWLNASGGYFPEATSLAHIDQSRLVACLSHLYDTIDPLELSIDTSVDYQGKNVPHSAIPGLDVLLQRHSVEWVLENFEQHQVDESTVEFDYIGEEVHPLVNSPDSKVTQFLEAAISPERYNSGATAQFNYPDDTAILVKRSGQKWRFETKSDL